MKLATIVISCGCLCALLGCQSAITTQFIQTGSTIAGKVLDEENNPVEEAVVRVKATDIFTTTDRNGVFMLSGLETDGSYLLTAWAKGYFIGGGEMEYLAGESNSRIIIKKHTDEDNPAYQWVSAYTTKGVKGSNCENCHSASDEGAYAGINLPFDEWVKDAHSQAAINPRFLTMYTGKDMEGNQSPLTRYGFSRDYGSFPVRPDLTQPYLGPGYKLDFPESSGNCAACHVPVAAIDNAYGIDAANVSGVEREGVTCDFCHKVWDVKFNPITGTPYPNMPGVLSFEFRRPTEGHQFFAGPLDDVAPGEDTYTPIQQQSGFCAPCHFGTFWDTIIYNSFGEWLESPYSDQDSGKTCQDCHMPPAGVDHFARLDKGGVIRDPQTIFRHLMPGLLDKNLLKNAVTMKVSVDRSGDKLIVEIKIINDKTGHHVPTDSPLREMILLVQAKDPQGELLTLIEGPTLPDWVGVGDPSQGYYAGLPGKDYAKILMELWTEVTPTGAYWNPTRIVSDNRLAAFETDLSTFIFSTPVETKLNVNITLIFRRAFIDLMDQKSWGVADIVMDEQSIEVP